MNQNQALATFRKTKGFSLKEASQKTKIPRLFIYLFEHGYFHPTPSQLITFSKVYEVPLQDLGTRYDYPVVSIDSKKLKKDFLRFLKNKWALLVSSLVIAGSTAGTIVGVNFLKECKSNGVDQYGSSFQTAYKETLSKGELTLDIFDGPCYEYTVTDADENELRFRFPQIQINLFYASFGVTVTTPDGVLSIDYDGSSATEIRIQFSYSDDYSMGIVPHFTGIGYREENTIRFESIDSEDKELSKEKAQEQILTGLPYTDTYFEDNVESALGIKETALGLATQKREGNRLLNDKYNTGFLMGTGMASLLAVATFALMFSSFSLLGKYHVKKKEIASLQGDIYLPKRSYEPLPKDISISPFIPEFVIRTVGVLMLFLGSIRPFLTVASLTGFAGLGGTHPQAFNEATANFVSFAIILLFAAKMMNMVGNGRSFKSLVTLFLGGTILYICTVFFLHMIAETTMLEALLTYSPGNVVFGILVFSLYAFFLFYESPLLKSNKVLLICFRSLIILPLLYLVFSYIYAINGNLFGFSHYYLKAFLFPKSLIVSGFSILFVSASFVYRKVMIHRFGEEGFAIYSQGNRSKITLNIICAAAIMIMFVIDRLSGYIPYAKKLGIGNNQFMWVSALIMLFYTPHIGKRNALVDKAYGFSYGLSLGISYILIFLMIMIDTNWSFFTD